MTTDEAVKAAVTMLATAFNREVSDILLDAYWVTLYDQSPEQIERATRRAISECKFMPPPSELRDMCTVHVPDTRLLDATEAKLDRWRAISERLPTPEQMEELRAHRKLIFAQAREATRRHFGRVLGSDPGSHREPGDDDDTPGRAEQEGDAA